MDNGREAGTASLDGSVPTAIHQHEGRVPHFMRDVH